VVVQPFEFLNLKKYAEILKWKEGREGMEERVKKKKNIKEILRSRVGKNLFKEEELRYNILASV
jgi:hypothetical protein